MAADTLRRAQARASRPAEGGRHFSSAQAATAPKAEGGPFWLPLILGLVSSVAVSFAMEWRFIQVDPNPALPMGWSGVRVGLVAFTLFLGLGPLFVWIARGGVARAAERLKANEWRNAKRCAWALVLSAVAGGVGWALGILAANLQDNGADWRYSFLGMAFLAAMVLTWYFRDQVLRDAAWGYLVFSLAMGLSFVAIMPIQPNANWDGGTHFNTANAISYGEEARYDWGDILSIDGRPYVIGGYDGNRIWTDFSIEAADETAQALDAPTADADLFISEGTLRCRASTWVMTSAVGNYPAGMGLWFGRVLGLPNTGQLTCARLFNVFTYVFLWFFGLRYLKGSKLAFAAIALIPTSLYQAANFSYDPWLIAMFGLATCRYVGELQRPDEPLGVKRALAILVPLVLACMVKAVYFPMALGFWALGRGKFLPEDQARAWIWRIALMLVALAMAATFVLPFFMKGGEGFSDMRGGSEVNAHDQMELVLGDPMVFFRATGDLAQGVFHPDYFGSATAVLPYIAMSDYEKPLGYVYLAFLVAATLLLRSEADRPYAKARFKVLNLIAIAGAYLLFSASLYIGFTAVGGATVAGFQPKYLVPMFPALFGIVLNFPGIARRLGETVRRLLPQLTWLFLYGYFVVFIGLRFVVFFE